MSRKHAGFSLLELMIVVGILAIAASFALPNIRYGILNNNITAKTNEFVTVVNFARNQAITRNQNISVIPYGYAPDPDNIPPSDVWGNGWQVVWEPVTAGTYEILREFNSTSGNIKITASEIGGGDIGLLTFNRSGGINTNSINFIVCIEDYSAGDPPGRFLRVYSPTGRISVENRKYSECL